MNALARTFAGMAEALPGTLVDLRGTLAAWRQQQLEAA